MDFGSIHIKTNVLYTWCGIFGFLTVATIVYFLFKYTRRDQDFSEVGLRIRTWWVMIGLLFLAMTTHIIASLAFFALVSFLALKEFFSMIPTRKADRVVLGMAYLVIPITYYVIYIQWYGFYIVLIPVYAFLYFPMLMVLVGETEGFLKAVGTIQWGMMTTVFCISHGAYLLVLPEEPNPQAGGVGLLLFLLILTQLNDVAQFLWGKTLGRTKVAPKVSPGKTWEGLVGGVLTTAGLAFLLAPFLTPLSPLHAVLTGLMIGIPGFIGDITMSAIKRDIRIKDSGDILPGHGGILDRIDSLIFIASLYFLFVFSSELHPPLEPYQTQCCSRHHQPLELH